MQQKQKKAQVPFDGRLRVRTIRRMMSVLGAGAAISLALSACGSSSPSSTSKPAASAGSAVVACGKMKIGLLGPITGPDSSFGQADVDSANLAISRYNDSHPNCAVHLQLFDTQGNASANPAAATKAVQTQDIVAILGPEFSGGVEAAEPIFNEAGMPTVTSDATAISLASEGWKVFHRTIGSDGVEAPGDAIYTVKVLGLHSVAVINNGEAYGAGIAKAFAETLPKIGGSVAMTATINPTASNYSSTVLAIKGSNAQAVYCGCLYPEAARLLKQLRQGGVNLQFVGANGIAQNTFGQLAGSAANGALAGDAGVVASHYGPAASFLKAFVAKYGANAPQDYAPQGYDAAEAILKAIAAGNHSRSSIDSYLDTESFNGVSGHIKFLPNGNVETNQVNILEFTHGAWVYHARVTVPTSLQLN